ncbi:MAG: hypothetical protein VX278_08030, partial [Myxococcota bacterium]|nr:hypothetical protein [Myxococcota bacterium]
KDMTWYSLSKVRLIRVFYLIHFRLPRNFIHCKGKEVKPSLTKKQSPSLDTQSEIEHPNNILLCLWC